MLIVVYSNASALKFNNTYKTVSWKSIANYIKENEKKDEPIIVFRSNRVLTLAYYYDGINAIYGLPCDPQFKEYDLHTHKIKNTSQVSTFFDKKILPNKYFWIVIFGTETYRGININSNLLKDFIDEYCVIESRKKFQEARVMYMKLDNLLQLQNGFKLETSDLKS